MTSKEVIRLIQAGANEIKSQIIKDLIKQHNEIRGKMIENYNQYLGSTPITNRTFDNPNKLNNKLRNDYRGEIIDGCTGYLFGKPVVYGVSGNYSDSELQKINDTLSAFRTRNSIDDLDSTTGEYASVCGYGARLLYVDPEGNERVMNLKPWEVVFVEDATIDEIAYALIYYEIEVVEGKERKTRTKAEFYDKTNVEFWITDNEGNFIPDSTELKNPRAHLFDFVPVIRFQNNNQMLGDFEKVADLIDAYDRVMSDVQNEIEEFRSAYMAFIGAEIDEETITKARQTGAFALDEEGDIKFITKQVDAAFIENHKTTLNDNIYRFAKAVDMRDENFSGASQSGESRKWKLVALENKAVTKERKFVKALRYQFKVLCSAWAKKTLPLRFEDVTFQFTRNLPVDMLYSADVSGRLKGLVSDETRLGLLPFITDPKQEMQRLEEEITAGVSLGEDGGQI